MNDYILTVMAQDRVGIVRDVASALADLHGNITHVSQTVMCGYFTLIISVQMPSELTLLEIRQAIERKGDVGELEVNVRPYEAIAVSQTNNIERFTLTMAGIDRPGVIAHATQYLAQRDINIDDFYAYVLNGRFVILAQVSIPDTTDADDVRCELDKFANELEITAHLQHVNIFHATNEIRPVIDLQRKN